MNGRSLVSSSLLLGIILIVLPLTFVSIRAGGNLPSSKVYGSNKYPIYLVTNPVKGCNPNNKCASRKKIKSQTANKSILKRKSYSYIMTKLSSSHGQPRRKARVVNSRGRVILNMAVSLREWKEGGGEREILRLGKIE